MTLLVYQLGMLVERRNGNVGGKSNEIVKCRHLIGSSTGTCAASDPVQFSKRSRYSGGKDGDVRSTVRLGAFPTVQLSFVNASIGESLDSCPRTPSHSVIQLNALSIKPSGDDSSVYRWSRQRGKHDVVRDGTSER